MNVNLTAGQSVINNLELGARLSFCLCNMVSLSSGPVTYVEDILDVFSLLRMAIFNDAINFPPTVSVAH